LGDDRGVLVRRRVVSDVVFVVLIS